MYDGRVACCLLVSNSEYAEGTDKQMNGRTDGRPTVTLRFSLDAASSTSYPMSSRIILPIPTSADLAYEKQRSFVSNHA